MINIRVIALLSAIIVSPVMALTSYESPINNFKFEAPLNWYFLPTDVLEVDGSTDITVRWQSGQRPLLFFVSAVTHTDSSEALFKIYRFHFTGMLLCWKQSGLAPNLFVARDTVINKIHYLGSEISGRSVSVSYVSRFGKYSLIFSYETTLADYNLNRSEYYKIFQSMTFKNMTISALAKSHRDVGEYQKNSSSVFYTLLGQRLNILSGGKKQVLEFRQN